jgi:arylsulfatase
MVDAVVTLATNPDPASAPFRLGYVLGPLLVGVACGAGIGCAAVLASACWPGRGRHEFGVVAVCGAWLLGLLLEAARNGASAPAVVALGGGGAVAAIALGRLALGMAAALARLRPRLRRLAWSVAAAALVTGVAVTAPAGVAELRAGTGPCPALPGRAGDRPNLVLVTVDALRLDAAATMSSYRRLAARGVEFRQHTTGSPWTLPSVASILTGLPAFRHGAGQSLSSHAVAAKAALPPHLPTLAGVLGARGYRTHAVVTNPFLTARYGIDHGFCTFENVTMEGEAARALARTTPLRLARVLALGLLPSDRAHAVRARGVRWLGANDRRPFFLWVHFLDPHAPYGDRDGASTSLTLDLLAFQAAPTATAPFGALGRLRAGEYRPDAAERERIVALYREDVAYVDREIGRLLDFLDARDLAEHTAVVLTADHGEEFWDHGGVEHGRTLYEEVLRVPLVIAPAGGRSRGAHPVVTDLTAAEDLAPTVLALLGITREAGWEGLDVLATTMPPDRSLVLGSILFGEAQVGLRTSRFKYLRTEHGSERLFELAADPRERRDRAGALPGVLAAARRVYDRSGGGAALTAHRLSSPCGVCRLRGQGREPGPRRSRPGRVPPRARGARRGRGVPAAPGGVPSAARPPSPSMPAMVASSARAAVRALRTMRW